MCGFLLFNHFGLLIQINSYEIYRITYIIHNYFHEFVNISHRLVFVHRICPFRRVNAHSELQTVLSNLIRSQNEKCGEKQKINTKLIYVGSVDSIAHSDDLQVASMLSLTPPLTPPGCAGDHNNINNGLTSSGHHTQYWKSINNRSVPRARIAHYWNQLVNGVTSLAPGLTEHRYCVWLVALKNKNHW